MFSTDWSKPWIVHYYENGFERSAVTYWTREQARTAARNYRDQYGLTTRIARTSEFL